MPSKREILDALKRDDLIGYIDSFQVWVPERRSKQVLVDALASSKKAKLSIILNDLSRADLKAICNRYGLDDTGREKSVLIDRLLGREEPAKPKKPRKPSTAGRSRDVAEELPKPPVQAIPSTPSEPPRRGRLMNSRRPSIPPQTVFAPGARVLIRDEEWIVRSTRQASIGGSAVHVTGLSELVRNKDAIFLTDLDEITELRPEDTSLVHDDSPQYRRTKLYLESLLRQTPPTDEKLYIGHRGAMNRADYQLTPAIQALSQPRPRILIADAVGLGKTIEAGILLCELIRRGRGRRILVVALKSILEQFQEELWARFTIPLVRLDSVGLQRVRSKIPSNMNPFHYFDRVIISIDTLKQHAKYRTWLEQTHWDAIVIDECQHVAVRSKAGSTQRSQRADLAQLLARTCDALIMTSATPHDGRPESFASLMNLLEPTAVANESDYTADEIHGLYVRRFKKDIAEQVRDNFRERELVLQHVNASTEEDAVFQAIAQAQFKTIDVRLRSADTARLGHGALFRTLLIKSLLSSPQALMATVGERLKHAKLQPGPDGALSLEAEHDRNELQQINHLADQVKPRCFAKLEALEELLQKIDFANTKADHRAVIFSERIPTLEFLKDRLSKSFKLSTEQIEIFHGTLDDQKQQSLVKEFGSQKSAIRILLASDAAAEGINLHHFCNHLIHFDIPWSLMTLEQRNGRIDRYGQRETPCIHYLSTIPGIDGLRGDLRVLDRLVEKENAAHKNLGDTAWLLNLHDPEREAEHVAAGITEHKAPEAIIPDQPPEPEDNFLAALLAASDQKVDTSENQSDGETQLTVDPLRLYPDDIEYMREAFAELKAQSNGGVQPPEFHQHLKGVTLQAPPDLQQRFAYLPPELRRDGSWEFKLTTERDRVQQALQESRQQSDRWPEWQLLWEQHPIARWLNDRVVSHFARHEAPVISINHGGMQAKESAFLFQGIMSNKRSQPVIVEWFAVCFIDNAKTTIESLESFTERIGLSKKQSNPGQRFDASSLESLREAAVQAGVAHMKAQREARKDRLLPSLKRDAKRVKQWKLKALSQIEIQRQRATVDGRKLRADIQKRLDSREFEINQRVEARDKWIEEGLTTSDTPYLRLAAVFVSSDYGKGI